MGCGESGRVWAVVRDHYGDRTQSLPLQRIEQPGEKVGAKTGGNEGNDGRLSGHTPRMAGLG